MIANVVGVFLGDKIGNYTDVSQNINIDYHHVYVGSPDESHRGQQIILSAPVDMDFSSLNIYESYVFNIEIPTYLREKGKLKIVSVNPIK